MGDHPDDKHLLVSALRLELASYDISGIHPYPAPRFLSPQDLREEAWDIVRRRMAHIIGQRCYEHILACCLDMAECIAGYGEAHPPLRQELLAWLEAPQQADWLPCDMATMLRVVDDAELPPDGHNMALTDEERRLVLAHLPLVRKLAGRYSRHKQLPHKLKPLGKGKKRWGHSQVLFDNLERIGLEILEQQIRRWDRTRGVTFGKFVMLRLEGAMKDHIRTAPQTRYLNTIHDGESTERRTRRSKAGPHSSGWGMDRDLEFKTRDAKPYRRRRVVEPQYAAHSTTVTGSAARWLIRRRGPDPALEGALAYLNHKQRAVYLGRVLANPPVPRSQLAREIGEYETNIPRIEKQARRKIEQILRPAAE